MRTILLETRQVKDHNRNAAEDGSTQFYWTYA